jgi:SAM-dependent methyltransferase
MYFNDDITSKAQFSLVAAEYDLARPSYPAEIFKHTLLAIKERIEEGHRLENVLEVGSGSGQATVELAKISARLDCVEPGRDFVRLLRERFSASERITVFETEFESFQSVVRYDLVASACAIHWIPKEYFYGRINSLLKPSGWFLGIWHQPRFSETVYEVIRKTIEARFPNFWIPRCDAEDQKSFETGFSEFSNGRGFRNCWKRTYRSTRFLSPVALAALIWSYVDIANLPDADRRGLHESLNLGIHGLSLSEYMVEDNFPVAMGQNASME